MIDAELEQAYGLDEVPVGLAQQYARQAGLGPAQVQLPDAVAGATAPLRIQA
jgi:hypothetical protein